MTYETGKSYTRWTPFIRCEYTDGDGVKCQSWKPGVNHKQVSSEDFIPEWDGDGEEIRTVVAVTELHGGGMRILYRRAWKTPDGGIFGKRTVRITTPSCFTAWLRDRSSYRREMLNIRQDIIMERAA